MPTRRASATWEGGLREGKGSFAGESGVLSGSYSFGSRFADAGGTNPEELLAAAEAACFSMALSAGLEKDGHTPTRVHTDAACTVEKVEDGFKITTLRLRVRARVPGLDAGAFRAAAEATKSGCPVSKALAGVEISVEAELES
jgi:lipoyl-dependent peroxiredoxin